MTGVSVEVGKGRRLISVESALRLKLASPSRCGR